MSLPRFEPGLEQLHGRNQYKEKDDRFHPRSNRSLFGKSGWFSWLNPYSPLVRRLREYRKILTAVISFLILLRVFLSSSGGSTWGLVASGFESESSNVHFYDLGKYNGNTNGKETQDMLLMCIPLRNAAPVIPMMFSHLKNLTYPHHLIDIAFMVSDSDDATLEDLKNNIIKLDSEKNLDPFHEISIFEKDFGAIIGQGFDDRHGVKVQGVRRKLMGRARNWLLSSALKPYHSWVYWRDADIETSPTTIIEDLMKHGRDVIVPNVWRPLPKWLGGEQPYDLNSWQESDAALELAKTLHEDEVIVEGYAEYPTWRPHLAYFRSEDGNPDELIDLDGIGGVSILARAKVFRQGANFPGFAFENHAETEGFGKMSRKMGYTVSGLVHYTVWHQYEPSEDDLKHMKEMEEAEKAEKADPTVITN